MTTVTVTLDPGLKLGDAYLTEAEIRPATVGDMLAATAAAEQLVQGSEGPMLVASPTRVGFETLVRQIVRIGDLDLVTARMVEGLSTIDFARLQDAALALEAAEVSREVDGRGRGDGHGAASAPHHGHAGERDGVDAGRDPGADPGPST